MSRPIRDKMLGLDADLDAVRFPEASTIRARGKRRARRRAAAGAAVTTATALAGVGIAVSVLSPQGTSGGTVGAASPDGDRGAAPQPSCVTLSSPVDLALPADPGRVTVRVTGPAGDPQRPAELADGLRARGFAVGGDAAPGGERVTGTVIRYGPSAIGAASLLGAYLDGPVAMVFDAGRAGRTVELVLGEPAVRLRSATEVNRALVRVGEPSRPAGLCQSGPTGK